MKEELPIKIFLIDDDEDDRDFFCMAVEDSKFKIQCDTAKGAKEALARLRNKELLPDYIFLDLNMPEIDGRTCLKELKSDDTTKDIPVVIFTTSSESQDLKETEELGAMDFITKAASISALTLGLDNFLKNHSQLK